MRTCTVLIYSAGTSATGMLPGIPYRHRHDHHAGVDDSEIRVRHVVAVAAYFVMFSNTTLVQTSSVIAQTFSKAIRIRLNVTVCTGDGTQHLERRLGSPEHRHWVP